MHSQSTCMHIYQIYPCLTSCRHAGSWHVEPTSFGKNLTCHFREETGKIFVSIIEGSVVLVRTWIATLLTYHFLLDAISK